MPLTTGLLGTCRAGILISFSAGSIRFVAVVVVHTERSNRKMLEGETIVAAVSVTELGPALGLANLAVYCMQPVVDDTQPACAGSQLDLVGISSAARGSNGPTQQHCLAEGALVLGDLQWLSRQVDHIAAVVVVHDTSVDRMHSGLV